MGRGLSDLQKAFLVTAHNNIVSEGGSSAKPCDCFFPEILVSVYDMTPWGLHSWQTIRDRPRGQKFRRIVTNGIETCVDTRYDSAYAAVSRAARRLQGRGLVTIYKAECTNWTGISLTEKGRSVALDLVANGYVVRKVAMS